MVQQGDQPRVRRAQHVDLRETLLQCVTELLLEATETRILQSVLNVLHVYLCSCILISAEMPGRKDWSNARKIINEERSDEETRKKRFFKEMIAKSG